MVTPSHGHADRSRDGRGRFVRTTDTAERDAQACELRAQGYSYQRIAAALRYTDRSLARRAVERALAATVRDSADTLREIELQRLDAMWQQAWQVLYEDHPFVSGGRIVYDPATGQPLVDDGPVLAAIDRLLKISERRAKLLGLDAPTKVETITLDQVDAEIARLMAELARGE